MDCRPSQPRKQKGEAMSRNLPFVLLLAAGVVLVQERAEARHAAGAAEAQAQTQTRTDDAQATPAAAPATPQGQNGDAQAQAGEAQRQAGETPAPTEGDAKLTSVPGGKALGMSILGNQEAPKSLVIVPWKTSELGGSPGVSLMLDDSRKPVDKDVFMRALRYHEIRSGTTHPDGATAGSR